MSTTKSLVLTDNPMYAKGEVVLGEVLKESKQMVTYIEVGTGNVVKRNKFLHGLRIERGATVINHPGSPKEENDN